MFETPILLLIFNRPEWTKIVFEEIKKVQPSHLYIVSDGARKDKNGEDILVEKCRQIVLDTDWKCEVKTLFRDKNLGSGLGVYEGINWFFNQVGKGIILEDDCLPNNSFFSFCEELLNHYEHHENIMQISGSNYLLGFYKTTDYYFSQLPLTWGWATWKRAWQKMDYKMQNFEENSKKFPAVAELWSEHWKSVLKGTIKDAWDFQWYYSIYCNNGIIIHPSVNLVINIGFDSKNATHTFKAPWWYKFVVTKELKIKKFYKQIQVNKKADLFFSRLFSNQQPNMYQRIVLKWRSLR